MPDPRAPFVRLPQSEPEDPKLRELYDQLVAREQGQWSPTARNTVDVLTGLINGAAGNTDQQRPAEVLGSLIGQVGMAILPIGSKLRVPANRAAIFERLLAEAPSEAARVAIRGKMASHPRLLAHLTDVKPRVKPDAAAGIELNRHTPELRATLHMNPAISDADDAGRILSHELVHVSDGVRIADRARQAGIKEPPGKLFERLYKDAEAAAPSYNKNPFETRARTGEAAYDIPRRPGRFEEAKLLARDPTNSMKTVASAVGNDEALDVILRHQAQTLPAARRVGTPDPGPLDQLLELLDPRFVRR